MNHGQGMSCLQRFVECFVPARGLLDLKDLRHVVRASLPSRKLSHQCQKILSKMSNVQRNQYINSPAREYQMSLWRD